MTEQDKIRCEGLRSALNRDAVFYPADVAFLLLLIERLERENSELQRELDEHRGEPAPDFGTWD